MPGPAVSGEARGRGGDDLRERRAGHRVSKDQRHVVGRGHHARAVEAVHGGDIRTAGPERDGVRIHRGARLLDAPQLPRQDHRGVVAGGHEQPVEEPSHGVLPARSDAHEAALCTLEIRVGDLHDPVHVEGVQHDGGEQCLDHARGTVSAVRVLGRHDLTGVQVGDKPRAGGDVAWHLESVGRHDLAAGEPVTARRGVGHRGRGRGRLPGERDLGLVDGSGRCGAVRAPGDVARGVEVRRRRGRRQHGGRRRLRQRNGGSRLHCCHGCRCRERYQCDQGCGHEAGGSLDGPSSGAGHGGRVYVRSTSSRVGPAGPGLTRARPAAAPRGGVSHPLRGMRDAISACGCGPGVRLCGPGRRNDARRRGGYPVISARTAGRV